MINKLSDKQRKVAKKATLAALAFITTKINKRIVDKIFGEDK